MTIQVVDDSILMLVLNLLSLGSVELHTAQGQPIKGTPVLVPDPKMVIRNNMGRLKITLLSKQCASLLRIIFENHALTYQIQSLIVGSIQVRY